MDIPDARVGKVTLFSVAAVFVLLVFWINTYPFVDQETSIIPDPQWFLLFCALWGFLFIGGLMSLTLYHIYPHLSTKTNPNTFTIENKSV